MGWWKHFLLTGPLPHIHFFVFMGNNNKCITNYQSSSWYIILFTTDFLCMHKNTSNTQQWPFSANFLVLGPFSHRWTRADVTLPKRNLNSTVQNNIVRNSWHFSASRIWTTKNAFSTTVLNINESPFSFVSSDKLLKLRKWGWVNIFYSCQWVGLEAIIKSKTKFIGMEIWINT